MLQQKQKTISLRSTLTAIKEEKKNSFELFSFIFMTRKRAIDCVVLFLKEKQNCYFHDCVESDLSLCWSAFMEGGGGSFQRTAAYNTHFFHNRQKVYDSSSFVFLFLFFLTSFLYISIYDWLSRPDSFVVPTLIFIFFTRRRAMIIHIYLPL
jgi:hypothetical protein